MVSASILASPDLQLWHLLGLAQTLGPGRAEPVTDERGEVARLPGKAESACLDPWLL